MCAKLLMSDALQAYGPRAYQALLSMGFSREEYWSRLPFPSPGDLPNPGIKPTPLTSPPLAGVSLPLVPPGKPSLPQSDTRRKLDYKWKNT